MKFTRRRSEKNAFSLTEVLIAMALFAGTALVLIALFPVAQNTEQQSLRETRSTLIAESIMESLILGQEGEKVSVSVGITNGTPIWKLLHPTNSAAITLCYNASCEPLRELDPAAVTSPITDPQVVALATLTLTPKPSAPGLITAEVAVASPASAPAEHRTIQHFTRLVAIP